MSRSKLLVAASLAALLAGAGCNSGFGGGGSNGGASGSLASGSTAQGSTAQGSTSTGSTGTGSTGTGSTGTGSVGSTGTGTTGTGTTSGSTGTGTSGSTGATPISFAGQIDSLLYSNLNCSTCHVTMGQAFRLFHDANKDYTQIVNGGLLDTTNPANSQLLTMPVNANGQHPGGTALDPSSAEYQTILQWIQTGANP